MMKLKVIWPGQTRNREIRSLEEYYLKKINRLAKCSLIRSKEAKGIDEKFAARIKEIEAFELEKHIKDDYIICLFDEGQEMTSREFAGFLEKVALGSGHAIAFVLGGFLGLDERILKRADFLLSLSRMTFSHELSRVILLEQVYRSLTIIKGRHYAK
jgi:23S rRNA (pseudouridine1915-N3)-methyltransferase